VDLLIKLADVGLLTTEFDATGRDLPRRIEAFKRYRGDGVCMSQATKIVLGTVGVSAILAIAIIFALAFG
jgi:hypothetical protein